MITLPKILLTNAADGSAVGEAKNVDGNILAHDFPDLFSKALPGKATPEDGKTRALSTILGKVPAKGESNESNTVLNPRVIPPEHAEALLSAEHAADTKTASDRVTKRADTDNGNDNDKTLSNAELQTLSALFAMLPQPAVASSTTMPGNIRTAALSEPDAPRSIRARESVDPLPTPDSHAKKTLSVASISDEKKPAAPAQSQLHAENPVQPPTAYTNGRDTDGHDKPIIHQTNNIASLTGQATPAISTATVGVPTTTHIETPDAPAISAQLGSHEWQQQIAQSVSLYTRQGQHSAELKLHPEDLGQIQISLKLENNQAQLQMVSPHSHVRAALEAALPTLRSALAESGIQLGQSNISSENFAQQHSDQQQQQHQQHVRHGEPFTLHDEEADALPVASSLQRLANTNGAVDIFA